MAPPAHGATHSPRRRAALRQTWTGDGTVALQRTRFRGVWMNSANANVHLEKGALTFDNFRVTRDEGVGTGSFTYDFVKREVRLKDVKSTLRPDGRDSLDRAEALQGRRALQVSPAAQHRGERRRSFWRAKRPSRARRSMRPPGWITSSWAKRFRSIAFPGAFSLRTIGSSSAKSRARFSTATSAGRPTFPWRKATRVIRRSSRSRESISRAWPISISNMKRRAAA